MIILDTNVLSEALRPSPSADVLRWLAVQHPAAVYTTTITEAEVLYGVELLPAGKRRERFAAAVEQVFAVEFAGRILPFDEAAATEYPRVVASRKRRGQPVAQLDAMIAAIARSCHADLATRNEADFAHCGVRIVNPWKE